MTPGPGQWVVCMTTTPERLASPFLLRVLDSILGQQGGPSFQLLLSVPRVFARTGEAYPDPGFLLDRYRDGRLHIHRCPDHGPATKFLGLRTWSGLSGAGLTHVYIADDDVILRPGVFQRVQARGRRPWWRPGGHAATTVWANSVSRVGGLDVAEGFGGVLIPAGFFHRLFGQTRYHRLWDALQGRDHPCFPVDDMLLSRLLHMHGYRVRSTGLDAFRQIMDRTATDTHPEWFELCKHGPPRDGANRACLCAELPLPD